MNYKDVLEYQIKKLQELQEAATTERAYDSACRIADAILRLCDRANAME